MINKSELFISWHMLVKEQLDITIKALDSLQGLYDECLIAVDDDPSQDELFEAIKIYPNTFVYRQHLPNGDFSLARQDILDRVSKKATYIGWSDADEPLDSPSPREIREYLYNERPPAVTVTLRYLHMVGPCYPGDHVRLRMWRADEPRKWKDAVHEYPSYIGPNSNVDQKKLDIVFNHLKDGLSIEQAQHRITMMIEENKQNTDGWRYPRISGEYRGIGMYDEALKYAKLGILSYRMDVRNSSIKELMFVCDVLGDKWNLIKDNLLDLLETDSNLNTCPMVLEYLALSYYYTNDFANAVIAHDKALLYDTDKNHSFIYTNDKFFKSVKVDE